MNGNKEAILSSSKFGEICRICLKHEENMADMFESGIIDQVTHFTQLEVTVDDKLPKRLCSDCSIQVDCLYKFQQLAKSSDAYLRSILENESENENKNENCDKVESAVKASTKHKQLRKKKTREKKKGITRSLEKEQMYLIVVPEVDKSDSKENSEILIKNVFCDSDDSELSQLCKTLFRNDFSDHTYPKHPIYQHSRNDVNINGTEFVDEESRHESESAVTIKRVINDAFKENKVLDVNVVIFKCDMCKESYEEITDLCNHYLEGHHKEPPIFNFSYKCPVCSHDEDNKEEFFRHLQNHKSEGFLFHKVNCNRDKIPLNENDRCVFVDPNLKLNTLYKIFKLNLQMFKCTVCDELLETRQVAKEHLKKCASGDDCKQKIYLKHTCPVCQLSFFNEGDKYISHLRSHKEENVFYIKVNNSWQPAELDNDEKLFIPHAEAMEIIKMLSSNILVKIYHVFDIHSCSSCDYVAESFDLLFEHCQVIHKEFLKRPSLVCPVCSNEFNFGHVDDCKVRYYKHLLTHRGEGVVFAEMKNNGSLSSFNQAYSNLFTQSSILSGLANGSVSVCAPKVWHPEVVVYRSKPQKPYKCDICKEVFSHKLDLVKHIESHQTKYICERCGKIVTGSKRYTRHVLMHLNKLNKSRKKPTCSICNKRFASRTTLYVHLKYHAREDLNTNDSELRIICDKCGEIFHNIASLSSHSKIHGTGKENAVLKCDICDKDFSKQISYERHKSAHLNPKYLECAVCRHPLPSSASLEKHMEQHKSENKTYDCKSCKVSFLSKDSLKAHQTHTGHYADQKPFECNVCQEKFYLSRKFAQHIKTHPKYKMGKCTLCGKRLATFQSLTLHMGRHFKANSILCPHCGKQFFEEKNYHRHLMTHKGVKPFLCDLENCDKSFYTLFELNRHKKYHLNKRDYRCSYCSKTFHEANHLTVHIRTHTGERPYTCPHCNKGFITRSRCKQHIKIIHQGIGYDMIQSSISKKVTVFENEHKTQTVGESNV